MIIRETVDFEVPNLQYSIRYARGNSQRTLEELCREAGMSVSNWYKIENCEVKALPRETLRRMEEALGADFGVDEKVEISIKTKTSVAIVK